MLCFVFFPRAVNASEEENNNKQHADPVNATRTACVSRALWIPLGSLRGDRPGELQLQLHQELAGGLRKQRRRHCQPEPAHLPLGRRGTQIRGHLAGKFPVAQNLMPCATGNFKKLRPICALLRGTFFFLNLIVFSPFQQRSWQVFARLTMTAEGTSSAATPEVSACPAGRSASVARGTPCVAQETAASTVRKSSSPA